MKAILLALTITVTGLLILPGCPKKPVVPTVGPDYNKELPPGKLALRKITDPKDIPDFTQAFGNQQNLRPAINNSLDYLAKPTSQKFFPYGDITHAQAVASLQAFQTLLASSPSPAQLNAAVREKFDVYISVGCDDRGTVRFTGYYTPIFKGSRTPVAQYRYPLYRLPADHELTPEGTVALKGHSRQDIEQGNLLAGQELVYLADPFEVFIVHVQGSAIIQLDDGSQMMIGYAGNNGFPYKSIRQELIADGKIPAAEANLQSMISYFRQNPSDVQKYTWRDPRFVFFAQTSDPTPRGSINEPVTPMRTTATDKTIFPRACLSFISTTLPTRNGAGVVTDRPYTGFTLDQDTGGAIRAAGRCDIYMGIGKEAGEKAGRTVQDGKLYYLFLKPSAMTPAALPAMTGSPTGAAAPAPITEPGTPAIK